MFNQAKSECRCADSTERTVNAQQSGDHCLCTYTCACGADCRCEAGAQCSESCDCG